MTFYTYVHCKSDGAPFYVGKGRGSRCYQFVKNRNRFYKNIVDKHSVATIEVIVFPCATEFDAFVNEIMTIQILRLAGFMLANLTDGGEGPAGMHHSDETKKRLSISHAGKKFSDDHKRKIGMAHAGKKQPPMSPSHLRALLDGAAKYKITDEVRGKLSRLAAGNKHALGLKRGPMPDGQRAKISISKKGTVPWNKGLRK